MPDSYKHVPCLFPYSPDFQCLLVEFIGGLWLLAQFFVDGHCGVEAGLAVVIV